MERGSVLNQFNRASALGGEAASACAPYRLDGNCPSSDLADVTPSICYVSLDLVSQICLMAH